MDVSIMGRKYLTKVLGIDGTRLTLDGKPFDFEGLSFFNAIYNPTFNQNNQERSIRLKDYRENGINALRVWCQWNFGPPSHVWVDTAPENTMYTDEGEIREDSFAKLAALIELADNLGMLIEVVLFSHEKQPNFPAEILEKAAGNMAEKLKPYGNILLQIWNEDSTEIFRCFKKIKETDPERITTSSPGLPSQLGDDEQNYMLDILTPHTVRGKAKICYWEEAACQIEYLMKRFRKPVIDDEPARTGISKFGGIPGSKPEQHIEQIKLVRALGAYHTYHHDMFQNGYGNPATPPQAIPNPYFSDFHRPVFEFLKITKKW
jgi:hypothetical protein